VKAAVKKIESKIVRSSIFVPALKLFPKSLQYQFVTREIYKNNGSRLPAKYLRKALSYGIQNNPFTSKNPIIIGFLPKGSDGWILEFLFRDISKYAQRYDFIVASSIQDLSLYYFSAQEAFVVSMHQSFVPQILNAGIPSIDVASFYTHSRIGLDLAALSRIRTVLPMNTTEAAMLILGNITPSAIRVFPAGYDNKLFNSNIDSRNKARPIDILFVCRYEDPENRYYYLRKNYHLLIELTKVLNQCGYKVAILGKGWDSCCDDDFKQAFEYFEVDHNNYPSIYRRSKLLLIPSLQEGGPISWLEAMACGCLTLSTSSGFPAELRNGQLGSFLMPINSSVMEWVEEVSHILSFYGDPDLIDISGREAFLKPATFPELADVIESIANTSSKSFLITHKPPQPSTLALGRVCNSRPHWQFDPSSLSSQNAC
jgi:glycosyltransferase involved in cell wall biosynthesis